MPKFEHLFRGFRSDLRALLPLGVVFLGGMLIAVRATALIDGGQLIALLSGTERPTEAMLGSGRLQVAMLFGAACALPTLLATWFAPALVVFNDAGARIALLTSLRAVGRQLAPDRRLRSRRFRLGRNRACLRAGHRAATGRRRRRSRTAVRRHALHVRVHRDLAHLRLRQLSRYFPAAMPQAPAAAVSAGRPAGLALRRHGHAG